jgi:hypothetical protein
MDPASSFLAGHITGKLLDKLGVTFKTHVVDRWSRRRAEVFFEEFCAVIGAGSAATAAEIAARLTRTIEDESCSEVLFDAYRRVTLARSRNLGPRIIALLTAEIVAQHRIADDVDDSIYLAAENLTDGELLECERFVRQQQDKSQRGEYGLRIMWNEDSFDSMWHRETSISTAPLDLNEAIGRWATKLKMYGLLADDVKERHIELQPGDRRHSLDGGSIREVEWWIDIPNGCFRLVELVERARTRTTLEASVAPVY